MKSSTPEPTPPPSIPTPPPASPAPPSVLVRVLKHGTCIGSLICAVGHQQHLPQPTAERMAKLNLVQIIGI